jgi:MerR family redox-sensitive transcriptional activator SoxR
VAELRDFVTISELAARSGVAPSGLRYYESRGLIVADRTRGNHRRYPRAMLRRVAFIRAAAAVGLSLDEVAAALATLPPVGTPRKSDWARLSRAWRSRLDSRIEGLERLRDELTGCIGCGCLSLRRCTLLNAGDRAATRGTGARFLFGDDPENGD